MLSIKSSMQTDIEEEEAHSAFNDLLLSIRNPMKCALEEEAFIIFESVLLAIRNAMPNAIDIEEEGNIPCESLLLSSGTGKGTPSFYLIHE
jgi:hypothetical protein